jgi:hypothetical protein
MKQSTAITLALAHQNTPSRAYAHDPRPFIFLPVLAAGWVIAITYLIAPTAAAVVAQTVGAGGLAAVAAVAAPVIRSAQPDRRRPSSPARPATPRPGGRHPRWVLILVALALVVAVSLVVSAVVSGPQTELAPRAVELRQF